ncbi:MAG: YcgL domain-containing protein [Gammaproteobacteria bacterium]|nr:YcgL domain-containing protein [Gammaproteobacteria bacterium]
MHTWVYKGSRKDRTYLYVTAKDNFDRVPEALIQLLGKLEFVLHTELTENRRLAQVDAETVIKQLQLTGYYLQLPPATENPGRRC